MMRHVRPLLAIPTQKPRATLIAALLLTAAAVVGCFRLQVDTSLNTMFPQHDDAARVMLRVLDHFGAVDELLVLATLPPQDAQPDPQRLSQYAARFRDECQKSDAGLWGDVVYQREPDIGRFVEHELVPNAVYYLDDASLAAARQRLTPQGMNAQLQRDRSLLMQPGPAGELAKSLLRDPLNLHEFLAPRLASVAPFSTYQNSDDLISPDGRAILIRVIGKRAPTDLDYTKRLMQAITEIAQRAQPGELQISFTGAYAIAAQSERSIRHDAVTGINGSIALLLVLFIAVYRRPVRQFLLAFTPVAVGILWGFAVYALALRSLSPIAAVIGGVLAGMGIDYSVLYLTRYRSLRAKGLEPVKACGQTLEDIGPALLAACVTSVAGFAAVGWSTVAALREFAILGTLGLVGCFLASLIILPAALTFLRNSPPSIPGRSALRFQMGGLLAWIEQRRILLLTSLSVIGLAGLVIACWPGPTLKPETDLTVMHPRPNPALDAEEEFSQRFHVSPGWMLIYLQAQNSDQLVRLAYEVQRRLASAAVRDAGVTQGLSLANWLPDPEVVGKRAGATTQNADHVVSDFKSAIKQNGFNPSAFDSYANLLRTLVDPGSAPTMATLLQYPALARDLVPTSSTGPSPLPNPPPDYQGRGKKVELPTEAVTFVMLNRRTEDRAARDAAVVAIRQALAGLGGATLSGLPVVGYDAESAIWRELDRVFLAAAALVGGYLILHFRGIHSTILSLLPAIFGLAGLAAIIRLADIRLNMVNIVAIPLLIGIDVDYGIYLVTLARRRGSSEAVSSAAHAVLVCSTSMIVGYASLMWTSVPAVRSLGEVVAIGVALCVLAAYFLLCPLLIRATQ